MLNKIICKLRGHSFGKWAYETTDSCGQIRSCERDGFIERRVPHQFGEWEYDSDNSCTQSSTCERCGKLKSRISHDWGEWQNIQNGERERSCLRCQNLETSKPSDYYDHSDGFDEEGFWRVMGSGGTNRSGG